MSAFDVRSRDNLIDEPSTGNRRSVNPLDAVVRRLVSGSFQLTLLRGLLGRLVLNHERRKDELLVAGSLRDRGNVLAKVGCELVRAKHILHMLQFCRTEAACLHHQFHVEAANTDLFLVPRQREVDLAANSVYIVTHGAMRAEFDADVVIRPPFALRHVKRSARDFEGRLAHKCALNCKSRLAHENGSELKKSGQAGRVEVQYCDCLYIAADERRRKQLTQEVQLAGKNLRERCFFAGAMV
jgi:hypothetical protein